MNAKTAGFDTFTAQGSYGNCAACGAELDILKRGAHPRVPAHMRGGTALACVGCGGLHIGEVSPISEYAWRTSGITTEMSDESFGDGVSYFDAMIKSPSGKVSRVHGFYNTQTGKVLQYG